MPRFLPVFLLILLSVGIILGGCTEGEVDRNKELQAAMKSNDVELSAAFLENASSFKQVSDFLEQWAANAGLEVSSTHDHYIILRNPATEGYGDVPTTTLQCRVNPEKIRSDSKLLSLSMACLLGPVQHGKITLMVTEGGEDDDYVGAETVKKKSLKEKHLIHLEMGGSAMVYVSGAQAMTGNMSCDAPATEPKYTQAYRITCTIPDGADPYRHDKSHDYPNPIETIGNLLASAKSSGRLFEIASFNSKTTEGSIPHTASAVVVIDENNVEAFTERFDKSYEGVEKKFKGITKSLEKENKDEEVQELPEFTYTMEEVPLPEKVLDQSGSDNIISLMYTLQTGITQQSEETGEVESVSYISKISTTGGKFSLTVPMRGLSEDSLKELSGTYQITSGLCDVDYSTSDISCLWSAKEDGKLADFFLRAVNEEKENSPVYLGNSECNVLGARGKDLDMIYYRVNSDHRNTAIKNILAYTSGEDVPE